MSASLFLRGVSGGPKNGQGPKSASLVESGGGRLRFTVELQPGETTVVSWTKLLREANLTDSNHPESSTGPSFDAQPSFVSQPPPPSPPVVPSFIKNTNDGPKDSQPQVGSSRLTTVIERIERIYGGNGISDEENEDLILNNDPDDDEYDTEDSFIDDSELDDYFLVDNSAIKHDGFFVNRGKLECIEPIIPTDQQPKKRCHIDLTKGSGSDDGRNPHKIVKKRNKGKMESSMNQRSSTSQSKKEATRKLHMSVMDPPENAAEVSLKKTADVEDTIHPSGLKNVDGVDLSIHQKGKHRLIERFDLNLPADCVTMPNVKTAHIQSKDGALEKAIEELEKLAAETRPPPTETLDLNNASQAVKRRMPFEIKLKLGEIARITQAKYGEVPKDVINHLMSIVGHLMRTRTLKRNLKAMASVGLSAKPEKDERIEKIKHEVKEMIKSQILCMKSKEVDPEEKKTLIHRYSMDDELESKICDLYDFFVEKMEEDSGSRVKELYEELALLWPSGIMHADGIERAIHRAKERKGLFSRQTDLGRKKKKEVLSPEAVDSGNVSQATNFYDKLLSGSRGRMLPPHAQPRELVKRKPDPEVAEAQLQLEKLAVSAREERPSQRKRLVNKSNARPPAPSGPST